MILFMIQTKGSWEDSNYVENNLFLNCYSKFVKAIENEDKGAIYFRAMDLVNLFKHGDKDAKKFLPVVIRYCPDIKKEI